MTASNAGAICCAGEALEGLADTIVGGAAEVAACDSIDGTATAKVAVKLSIVVAGVDAAKSEPAWSTGFRSAAGVTPSDWAAAADASLDRSGGAVELVVDSGSGSAAKGGPADVSAAPLEGWPEAAG